MKKILFGISIGLIIGTITTFASSVFFNDVSTNTWYSNAVINLSDKGIIKGYSDGTFGPTKNVSRAELAVMLDRLIEYIETGEVGASNSDKVWIETEPIQCLENAWERAWIVNNPEAEYPRGHILVIEDVEKEIIKSYYEKRGIEIFDIRAEKNSGDFLVCAACDCPQGYVLYLKIASINLEKMRSQGVEDDHYYKTFQAPVLMCEDYTFSNCPKGCQKHCRSSNCSEGPNPSCTDDCE